MKNYTHVLASPPPEYNPQKEKQYLSYYFCFATCNRVQGIE